MAGKIEWSQWRIQVAIVIAIVASVITASTAKEAVQGAAPIRLPHSCDIVFGVIASIEVNVSVVDIVDHIGIVIEQRTTLAA